MRERRGQLRAKGRRFAVVVSRFNEAVTRQLLQGATDCLLHHGVLEDDIEIVWVPGSWELPVAVEAAARTGRFQGIVALGALIKGETAHFDVLANSVAQALARIGVEHRLPVGFGVLTAYTAEQAFERAAPEKGNKGWDAAQAVLEVADLVADLSDET
ncbi:MAG: 6,7-dimethyl-8-ribityllumazine synthase [Gemmatimonadetes bacterium]|nr:6,7-dimethyl-8-ribityllumazine synthase [Gemmatimonadota bacterium]